MQLTSGIMMGSGLLGLVFCTAWLIWCASRDGAIPDGLLLMTGMPIFTYAITQWENAKRPLFGVLLCLAAFVAGVMLKNVGRAIDQPLPNEAATGD